MRDKIGNGHTCVIVSSRADWTTDVNWEGEVAQVCNGICSRDLRCNDRGLVGGFCCTCSLRLVIKML